MEGMKNGEGRNTEQRGSRVKRISPVSRYEGCDASYGKAGEESRGCRVQVRKREP